MGLGQTAGLVFYPSFLLRQLEPDLLLAAQCTPAQSLLECAPQNFYFEHLDIRSPSPSFPSPSLMLDTNKLSVVGVTVLGLDLSPTPQERISG